MDMINDYGPGGGDVVSLKVAVHREHTTQEQIETYIAAVWFLAWWMEKQDGAAGFDTTELFEHLKQNVCAVMAQGASEQ